MTQGQAMTVDSVRELLEESGAKAMARSGRTDNYGAPREFSFEVKAVYPNGMGLHVVARQFNYRDPWEAEGRINEVVDASLLRDGQYSEMPKGFEWFQGRDEECGLDAQALREVAEMVRELNPKLYTLQALTGDL